MTSDNRETFSAIYEDHAWKSTSRSGPGSEPQHTITYRAILKRLLKTFPGRRIVDLGCGDWSFSRLVDWSGFDYTGVDVVPELIENLNQTFGKESIRFVCSDFSREPWPEADLYLCKDVLQHWPNEAVARFLDRLGDVPYAVITNDYRKLYRAGIFKLFRWQEPVTGNPDIAFGGSRPLQLTEPPFSWNARRLGLFESEVKRTRYIKEILLWRHPDRPELDIKVRER